MLSTVAANLFARYRWAVALFVIGMTAAATWGMSRLAFDDVPRSVFKTTSNEFRSLDRFFADFDSDDADCLLVVDCDDLFSPDGVRRLRKLIDQVAAVPGVKSTRSLADVVAFDNGRATALLPRDDATPEEFAAAKAAALKHPLVRGQVLAETGNTALVLARLDGQLVSIGQIQPIVERLGAIVHAADGDGFNVRLTGVPAIRVEIYAMVRRESSRFIFIGAGLAFVMATLLFRQFWAAVIVAAAPILGSFWTLGALGLVGEKLNVINTMLPTLVMVIGFADAMHVMTDIRHALAEGFTPIEASKLAIKHMLVACLLTAGTTAIGFGALALAEVDIIRRFGLAAAAGSLLSLLAVMSLIPLLTSTRLGQRVKAGHSQDFVVRHFDVFARGLDWILRHAWPVTIAGTAITLLLSLSMFYLVPDNRLIEMIPRDNESYNAVRHIDERLGGSLTTFVVVDWPADKSLHDPEVLAAIDGVEQMLAGKADLKYPLSVIDLLKALPGTGDLASRAPLLSLVPADVLRRYARPERRRALVSARMADIGSAHSRPLFDSIDADLAKLERQHPGIKMELTGTAMIGARSVHKMIESLNQSLLGAAVAIFGSIAVGFRSIRLAAISVLPNVFPMVATATLLVLTGRPLQMTSVMVFSICLGIAVDDTIHFLNRFQREMRVDGDVRAALRRSFHAVGSAVITTTMVLLTGFGSVLTSEMPSSRLFAWLSCTAYSTAIIGDLILLPALLACFYGGRAVRNLRPYVHAGRPKHKHDEQLGEAGVPA